MRKSEIDAKYEIQEYDNAGDMFQFLAQLQEAQRKNKKTLNFDLAGANFSMEVNAEGNPRDYFISGNNDATAVFDTQTILDIDEQYIWLEDGTKVPYDTIKD